MDEARLSPCRTCGKEISTNLYEGSWGGYRRGGTAPQGCPNCGEAEPHITQEDIERRKEQQKLFEEENKKKELEKEEARLEYERLTSTFGWRIWNDLGYQVGMGCLSFVILSVIFAVLFFWWVGTLPEYESP